MASRNTFGGVIHTYQKYDPRRFPSPLAEGEAPDAASAALEHMLLYGTRRELTEEELARAIRLDPSQIAGFGPSIDALTAILEERKRKILARWETRTVRRKAAKAFSQAAQQVKPPKELRERFHRAVRDEQLRDLERLWYAVGDDQSPAARQIVAALERLGDKYEVEELAAKYEFTGREGMTVPLAIEIKEELEKIDELLRQLEEARQTGQIALIDMEALAEFAPPEDVSQLSAIQQQVQDLLREIAERQGLERKGDAYHLTPQAYRIFQSKLLERLFRDLAPSRTGRHAATTLGEGAVELPTTKEYEFGDSIANLDVVGSFVNSLIRTGPTTPVQLRQDDLQIHRTRNNPKCATCVVMDMSGSMRYDGQYVNVKRMALALEGLIRTEYPGDYLHFVEMASFAKPVPRGQLVELMPKPVTVFDPIVRLRADMSRDDVSEYQVPPHFTNIQHGLATARRLMANQDSPNKQIVLITDGLPTAHFEGEMLYLLYPPDPRTEAATLREGELCRREGITINLFLLQSWSQSEEDIRFAYKLAEGTKGRVFFTAGRDLDRYVVWDYVSRRREIVK